MDELRRKICVAYDIDGERVEKMPYHQSDFHKATPIYENFQDGKTTYLALPTQVTYQKRRKITYKPWSTNAEFQFH